MTWQGLADGLIGTVAVVGLLLFFTGALPKLGEPQGPGGPWKEAGYRRTVYGCLLILLAFFLAWLLKGVILK